MKNKVLILLLFLIVCFSCEKKENLDITFKKEILKYQKAFPLPEKTDSLFPFYIVKFRKKQNDTLFNIYRAQAFSSMQYNEYGIFEDEKLKPTIIIDFDSLGRKLIKDYPERKGERFLKSGPLKSSNPFYLYHLDHNKINFLKTENY